MIEIKNNPWETIEVAKILVSLITPTLITIFGFYISKRAKHIERNLVRIDKLSSKRFEIYDRIGHKINDIFSYIVYVGRWKDFTPSEIVEKKRDLDSEVYTYAPIFSSAFMDCYQNFMEAAFSTYNSPGKDARIRAAWDYRLEQGNMEFRTFFTQEDNFDEVKSAYSKLLSTLATELDLPSKNI